MSLINKFNGVNSQDLPNKNPGYARESVSDRLIPLEQGKAIRGAALFQAGGETRSM